MDKLLDANAILRYLLNDQPAQALATQEVIKAGACTVPEVLSECVYVLTGSVYSFERSEAADALLLLLDDVPSEHEATMRRALELFRDTKLDFVDCDLAARHEVEGVDVHTFDKKLNRVMGIESS